jgi:hypothetical protein
MPVCDVVDLEAAEHAQLRRGRTRSRADVMTPSVPSLPSTSWVQLGPRSARCGPSVSITSPRPVTSVRPATRSSTLPYFVDSWPAARVASQPPTVEQ